MEIARPREQSLTTLELTDFHLLASILVTAGAMLTSARQSQEVAWKRRTTAECCSDSHTPSPETATQLILRCVSPLPLNWCCKKCVPTLIFQRSKNFVRPKNAITLIMMITTILNFRPNMNGISSCKVLYGQNKVKRGLPPSLKK